MVTSSVVNSTSGSAEKHNARSSEPLGVHSDVREDGCDPCVSDDIKHLSDTTSRVGTPPQSVSDGSSTFVESNVVANSPTVESTNADVLALATGVEGAQTRLRTGAGMDSDQSPPSAVDVGVGKNFRPAQLMHRDDAQAETGEVEQVDPSAAEETVPYRIPKLPPVPLVTLDITDASLAPEQRSVDESPAELGPSRHLMLPRPIAPNSDREQLTNGEHRQQYQYDAVSHRIPDRNFTDVPRRFMLGSWVPGSLLLFKQPEALKAFSERVYSKLSDKDHIDPPIWMKGMHEHSLLRASTDHNMFIGRPEGLYGFGSALTSPLYRSPNNNTLRRVGGELHTWLRNAMSHEVMKALRESSNIDDQTMSREQHANIVRGGIAATREHMVELLPTLESAHSVADGLYVSTGAQRVIDPLFPIEAIAQELFGFDNPMLTIIPDRTRAGSWTRALEVCDRGICEVVGNLLTSYSVDSDDFRQAIRDKLCNITVAGNVVRLVEADIDCRVDRLVMLIQRQNLLNFVSPGAYVMAHILHHYPDVLLMYAMRNNCANLFSMATFSAWMRFALGHSFERPDSNAKADDTVTFKVEGLCGQVRVEDEPIDDFSLRAVSTTPTYTLYTLYMPSDEEIAQLHSPSEGVRRSHSLTAHQLETAQRLRSLLTPPGATYPIPVLVVKWHTVSDQRQALNKPTLSDIHRNIGQFMDVVNNGRLSRMDDVWSKRTYVDTQTSSATPRVQRIPTSSHAAHTFSTMPCFPIRSELIGSESAPPSWFWMSFTLPLILNEWKLRDATRASQLVSVDHIFRWSELKSFMTQPLAHHVDAAYDVPASIHLGCDPDTFMAVPTDNSPPDCLCNTLARGIHVANGKRILNEDGFRSTSTPFWIPSPDPLQHARFDRDVMTGVWNKVIECNAAWLLRFHTDDQRIPTDLRTAKVRKSGLFCTWSPALGDTLSNDNKPQANDDVFTVEALAQRDLNSGVAQDDQSVIMNAARVKKHCSEILRTDSTYGRKSVFVQAMPNDQAARDPKQPLLSVGREGMKHANGQLETATRSIVRSVLRAGLRQAIDDITTADKLDVHDVRGGTIHLDLSFRLVVNDVTWTPEPTGKGKGQRSMELAKPNSSTKGKEPAKGKGKEPAKAKGKGKRSLSEAEDLRDEIVMERVKKASRLEVNHHEGAGASAYTKVNKSSTVTTRMTKASPKATATTTPRPRHAAKRAVPKPKKVKRSETTIERLNRESAKAREEAARRSQDCDDYTYMHGVSSDDVSDLSNTVETWVKEGRPAPPRGESVRTSMDDESESDFAEYERLLNASKPSNPCDYSSDGSDSPRHGTDDWKSRMVKCPNGCMNGKHVVCISNAKMNRHLQRCPKNPNPRSMVPPRPPAETHSYPPDACLAWGGHMPATNVGNTKTVSDSGNDADSRPAVGGQLVSDEHPRDASPADRDPAEDPDVPIPGADLDVVDHLLNGTEYETTTTSVKRPRKDSVDELE